MNHLPGQKEGSALKKSFGSTVKALRKHQHLSQEELGLKAGLHRTYVTDVERGARNLSLISISKLARALGTSMAELFSDQVEQGDKKFRAYGGYGRG
jgi:transcriptional regulator with XRE-family HTH domain